MDFRLFYFDVMKCQAADKVFDFSGYNFNVTFTKILFFVII